MFPSRKYRTPPIGATDFKNEGTDLALISFDADVAPAIARRAASPPTAGEIMTIVGFGNSDINKNDHGTKRLGYSRLQSNDDNVLVMHGVVTEPEGHLPGQMSAVMQGDSGGGIFNAQDELTGINASLEYDLNKVEAADEFGNILGTSKSVSLAHPTSKSLLDGIKKDFCAGNSLDPGQSCPRRGICDILLNRP